MQGEPTRGTDLVQVRLAPPLPVAWNQEIEGAKMLLRSGLLPPSIRTPEQALYIILTGRDLGLSPVQSLRSIHVIQGKPELAADMQLAIFKNRGGRAAFRKLTDTEAVLWLRHPNGDEHVETFTIDDARRAGLGGANWQKYPKAMLRSRAITAGLKSVGFDLLAGTYAEGEVGGPEPVLRADVARVDGRRVANEPAGGSPLGDGADAGCVLGIVRPSGVARDRGS